MFKIISRSLFVVGLLFGIAAHAATGDVSVSIETNGWVADLTVQGFTIGATYNFGTSTVGSQKNVPGANTPFLNVVSLGFDDTGTATTVTHKVYLTRQLRFPFSSVSLATIIGTGTFTDGETITQAVSGATGVVVGNQPSGSILYFKSVTGTFNNTGLLTGGTSGATATSTSTVVTLTMPTNSEEVISGNLLVRVALSDYVYQKDNTGGGNSGTAPTYTAPVGFIVNSGGASQSSTVNAASSVTQNSTAAYTGAVINWDWPDHSLIQGSTLTLRASAFQQSARQGRPVRCVIFTVSDTHSHTVTQTVLSPTYDPTVGDGNPVVEYIGSIATASFTNGDTLTANFTAYPWIGDSTAASTTSGGTQPSPNPAPQTYLCDTSQTYGQCAARVNSSSTITGSYTSGTFTAGETATQTTSGATSKIVGSGQSSGTMLLVSSVTGSPSATGAQTWVGGTSGAIFAPSSLPVANGNDGTGVVSSLSSYTATQAAYATITAAWTAIVSYNSSHGSNHADAGGSFVFCDNSYYALGGSSGTAAVWATLTANTGNGATQAGVIINSSGGTGFSSKTHPVGISFATNGTSVFNGGTYLWADNCAFHCNDTATVFNEGWTAFTRCPISQMTSGLVPFSTTNAPIALVRGNNFNGLSFAAVQWYTVIGNLHTTINSSNSFNLTATPSGATTVATSNAICAFNKFLGMWVVNPAIGGEGAPAVGVAVVQNLLENVSSANQLGVQLAADSSTGSTASNNFMLWNNTVIGCRCNLGYNDDAAFAPPRVYWSDMNNSWEMQAHKTDTFPSNPAANGARIGNWPVMWGVGFTGTYDNETSGFSAAASFMGEYCGINCFYPALNYANNPITSGSAGGFNAQKFISDLSTNASTNGTGGGIYLLKATSPLLNMQTRWLLPYDLAGQIRSGATSEAGCYATQYNGAAVFVAQ